MKKLTEIFNKYFDAFWIIFRETFYILIALLLLQLLFYIRFLPRVSRDLWVILTEYDLLYLLIRIFLIIVEIYFLVSLLQELETKSYTMPENSIKSNIIKFFSVIKAILNNIINFIKAILVNFYQFIIYLINSLGIFVFHKKHLCYNITRVLAKKLLFSDKKLIYGFLITLLILPKLLFILAFCYDVFITQYLHYSFKCIPFLLIPLIETFIVFVFTNFYEKHWKSISGFMDKRIYNLNNKPIIEYQFISPYRNKKPEWFLSFSDYLSNHYLILENINIFFGEYTHWKQKNKWFLAVLLSMSVLRLFAFMFLLIYGIT